MEFCLAMAEQLVALTIVTVRGLPEASDFCTILHRVQHVTR